MLIININDKLEAIRRFKNGALLRCVAEEYNICVSTVSDCMNKTQKSMFDYFML